MSELNIESYPPIFRQDDEQIQLLDTKIITKDVHDIDSDPVPLMDLHCSNIQKDELHEACKNWGLFRLINYEVPLTLLSKLHENARELFALPFESKKKLFNEAKPISYFWGTPALTSSGDALSRGPRNINWVEGLNVPLGQLSQFQAQDPMLNSFRLLLEDYGRHLSRIARTIFEAMAKSLNLSPANVASHLSEPTGLIRVYRYPHCSNAEDTWGIDVHTDSSVLSILSQDEVGGLEVLKENVWLQVKPIANTLIVNLGDMMQALSDDKYKSVQHRVKVNKSKERISICYFVFPADGSVIQSSNYKPFTYSEFQAQVQQDIKTHGFKVGLHRFKKAQ